MAHVVKRVSLALQLLVFLGMSACGDHTSPALSQVARGTYTYDAPSGALPVEGARRVLAFLAQGGLGEGGVTAHRQWLAIDEMNEALAHAGDDDLPPESRTPTPLEISLRVRLVLGSEWYSLHRELDFPAVGFSSSATQHGVWHAEPGGLVLEPTGSSTLGCSVTGDSIHVPYLGQEVRLTWESDSTEGATPTFVGRDRR